MLAAVTHILPFTIIRRERVLPVSGRVLVRAGQKVGATDVVVEANLSPEYFLLDVGRGLGISANKADLYVQCAVGDQLVEGDVVAERSGLGRRVVRAPRQGRVVLVGSGQVLVETTGKPFQLKAGMVGDVVELVGDRGAVIETSGALVQGVWGNGRTDFGLMASLAGAPDAVLTVDQIDVSLRGAIILAAHCQDAEVLKSAEEMPLRGIILASMPAKLAPLAHKLNIPVMLIEGFGTRPMNPLAYKLLTTNDRREVAINAETRNDYLGARPEVVIPLPGSQSLGLPAEIFIFAPGQRVRVLFSPHAGEIGQIQELKGRETLSNGLKTQSAIIRLESGERIIMPLANLEVIA